MIKHHPKLELLQSFVRGDLPASLSIGITLHADMCPICQEKIIHLTEQLAEQCFEEPIVYLDDFALNDQGSEFDYQLEDQFLSSMMNNITFSDEIDDVVVPIERTVSFRGKAYPLPTVLNNIEMGKTANIGKLSRARLQLNENEIHSNLLHINAGGGVPEHTHKGFELTVLLEGSFSDHNGEYNKGDFIMLDGTFTHNPVSEKGCLCYTVANNALHFTQGINKLLNPIGNFIY
jgi:putative transcriptional regulator